MTRVFGPRQAATSALDPTAAIRSPSTATAWAGRRNDFVHPQIVDELTVVVGSMPHREDSDTELRARPTIRTFYLNQRVIRINRSQYSIGIFERLAEVLHDFRLGLRGIRPA